ncbi:MAG: polysaccharide biosynthesis C-terminal domain-containing protein [Paludibacteraceae bacterium]|nr:polysaccharide biosynthesis C-terminal domain-containing protein [Paludibacteraceae bacterium]
MSAIKGLFKDTAIYGISSIVGRFLNWCLVPLYTYVLSSSADYGIVTNLYAWTALMMVILTYGMETGMFRFMSDEKEDANTVYKTALTSLFTTSLVFVVLCTVFIQPISQALGYEHYPEFVGMMVLITAMDAFDCIPFAYLRYKKQPIRFAIIKFVMIFANIGMNLFFLLLCPYLWREAPSLIDWFYRPDYQVGYIFVANLISTLIVTLVLLPYVFQGKYAFKWTLLKRMMYYSLPLLMLGVVGIMNQTIDKILFPYLYESKEVAVGQLGIYGACFKVAMVMMMFSQAFRYAYEPFVFDKSRSAGKEQMYADTMKYYVITSLLICLGMILFIDVIKLLIHESYWSGLIIVPIVLFSYLFQGIYSNLSIWYKLTDKTYYGFIISSIGLVINVSLLWFLVPRYGLIGAGFASFGAFFTMMLISYLLGCKYMPLPYDLVKFAKYLLLTLILMGINYWVETPFVWANYLIKIGLLMVFLVYMVRTDLPLSTLPFIGKYVKRLNN